MKQKYVLLQDEKNGKIFIREYAELDKEIMSMVCEQTYDADVLAKAAKEGQEALIDAFRTPNLFPPNAYSVRIADALIEQFEAESFQTIELVFDDTELITGKPESVDEEEDLEEESSDIDEILDDDLEEEFEEEDSGINNLNSPLKIADDESLDVDDDN
jgi:hypothetical protein